jgi:hypothetical protein
MIKLNDVKGYWSAMNKFDFNEEYMFDGQFILHDNGYFEGIVSETEYGKKYDDKRLIFGYYMPEKGIQLIKIGIGPLGLPQYYKGKRDAKGYFCEYGNVDPHGESVIGDGWVITRESIDQNLDDFNLELKKIKELIMSNERLIFYADFNKLGKDANPEMLVLQKVIKA